MRDATILMSDRNHPSVPVFEAFVRERPEMSLTFDAEDLNGGDDLFLVSCTQVIPEEIRKRYQRVMVLHESDLPHGRGWSPWAWQILEGANHLTVCLLFAAGKVDTGDVLRKEAVLLEGHELSDEIHRKLAGAKMNLIRWAMLNVDAISEPQHGDGTYYPKRSPEDSRMDPNKPIASQFDLLRICDHRFPAFFELRGHRYELTIK